MKYLFSCRLLFILVLFVSPAYAWNSETHKGLVENAYKDMYGIENLNLSLLKQGAVAPDSVFKDFKKHHFPESFVEMNKWLNISKESLASGDYNLASYAFGVAMHYLSDSFVAPHYVSGEDGWKHMGFENQARISTACLIDGSFAIEGINMEKMKKDWQSYLDGDRQIPLEAVDNAQKAVYFMASELFNAKCKERESSLIWQLTATIFVLVLVIIVWFNGLQGKKSRIKEHN